MDTGCREVSGIYFWNRGGVGGTRISAVHRAAHEVDAEACVVTGVVTEVADMGRRHKVHRAHQDLVRQASLHHAFHIPGPDHLIGARVEVELGPARGCVK